MRGGVQGGGGCRRWSVAAVFLASVVLASCAGSGGREGSGSGAAERTPETTSTPTSTSTTTTTSATTAAKAPRYEEFLRLHAERDGYDNGAINGQRYVEAMAESFCTPEATEQEMLSFVALAQNEINEDVALDWVLTVVDVYCPEHRELVASAGEVAGIEVDLHR